jgi:hypothetical protein
LSRLRRVDYTFDGEKVTVRRTDCEFISVNLEFSAPTL